MKNWTQCRSTSQNQSSQNKALKEFLKFNINSRLPTNRNGHLFKKQLGSQGLILMTNIRSKRSSIKWRQASITKKQGETLWQLLQVFLVRDLITSTGRFTRLLKKVNSWRLQIFMDSSTKKATFMKTNFMWRRASTKRNCTTTKWITMLQWKERQRRMRE